jgi:hypothetical protein
MAVQNTDLFLVERDGVAYKVAASDLESKISYDTTPGGSGIDYMLVERGGTKYKADKFDVLDATSTPEVLLDNNSSDPTANVLNLRSSKSTLEVYHTDTTTSTKRLSDSDFSSQDSNVPWTTTGNIAMPRVISTTGTGFTHVIMDNMGFNIPLRVLIEDSNPPTTDTYLNIFQSSNGGSGNFLESVLIPANSSSFEYTTSSVNQHYYFFRSDTAESSLSRRYSDAGLVPIGTKITFFGGYNNVDRLSFDDQFLTSGAGSPIQDAYLTTASGTGTGTGYLMAYRNRDLYIGSSNLGWAVSDSVQQSVITTNSIQSTDLLLASRNGTNYKCSGSDFNTYFN